MCNVHAILSSWLMIGKATEETASHNLPMNRNSINFPFLAWHFSSYKDSLPTVWARLTEQPLYLLSNIDGFKSKKLEFAYKPLLGPLSPLSPLSCLFKPQIFLWHPSSASHFSSLLHPDLVPWSFTTSRQCSSYRVPLGLFVKETLHYLEAGHKKLNK